MPYSVAIAGSTDRSRICASSIFADDRFHISGIITPTPKAVGRKQIVEPNPLHIFAIAHEKPLVIIEDKIDEEFHDRAQRVISQPDILLVVDFGYIIPEWMLSWAKIAPVNIHPSQLPKYRGSSPGQFALLFGEKDSAVSIMVMDEKMDHGPLIAQFPFSIDQHWKSPDYYQSAFDLVRENLTETLVDFIEKKSTPIAQPDISPTPVAKQLRREHGFVPLPTLLSLLHGEAPATPIPFFEKIQLETTPASLYNMWRGFYPWPGLWTTITKKGQEKRLKLLELSLTDGKLSIESVQIEGGLPQSPDDLL
jgi:methionyl-tRNA formyltransferase